MTVIKALLHAHDIGLVLGRRNISAALLAEWDQKEQKLFEERQRRRAAERHRARPKRPQQPPREGIVRKHFGPPTPYEKLLIRNAQIQHDRIMAQIQQGSRNTLFLGTQSQGENIRLSCEPPVAGYLKSRCVDVTAGVEGRVG